MTIKTNLLYRNQYSEAPVDSEARVKSVPVSELNPVKT